MFATRKTFIATTMLLVMSLFLLSHAPSVHPQASLNAVVPLTTATYGNTWNGNLVVGVSCTNSNVMFQGANVGYVVIMNDSDDSIAYHRESDYGVGSVKSIGLDTIMFQGGPVVGGASTAPEQATYFWNYVTNTTVEFPSVIGHHDIEYNPINNTFLTFNAYARQVGENTVLFDKIVEFSTTGNILWTWDTYDHIPLNEADPYNMTSEIDGQTAMDLTHANTLDWDYNNSIIYLNLRNTNTFYAINQTTSNIIWACGEFGNFTLIGDNGTTVQSLWYHSHDLKQVAPNIFSMFDNDFDNVTNEHDCHSKMIDVTLNMTTMTAWISWSYTTPTNYWSMFFGANVKLPNADRIGDFGTPTHQYAQNQPWIGNDTGAILVQVNQTGQVVKTFTFPSGWQIYRIVAATNLTPIILNTTPSTPAPTPTTAPVSTTPTIIIPTQTPMATARPTPTPSPTLTSAQLPNPTSTPSPTQSQAPTPLPTTKPSPTVEPTPLATLTIPPKQIPTPSPPAPASTSPTTTELLFTIILVSIAATSAIVLFKKINLKRIA